MNSKIDITGNSKTNDVNKRRGLESSVLIDDGSSINAGSLKRRGFEVRVRRFAVIEV